MPHGNSHVREQAKLMCLCVYATFFVFASVDWHWRWPVRGCEQHGLPGSLQQYLTLCPRAARSHWRHSVAPLRWWGSWTDLYFEKMMLIMCAGWTGSRCQELITTRARVTNVAVLRPSQGGCWLKGGVGAVRGSEETRIWGQPRKALWVRIANKTQMSLKWI